jgi:hypothetical protein
MKFHSGDRVIHASSGPGTIQVAGINDVCTVAFDNGNIRVVKTSELKKC